MISDEELQCMASAAAQESRIKIVPVIAEMATELLKLREEKRKAAESYAKSWEGAPEWANWRACDRDGVFFYYEIQPVQCRDSWGEIAGKLEAAERNDWKETLEPRP
jgi:hypothetical protein